MTHVHDAPRLATNGRFFCASCRHYMDEAPGGLDAAGVEAAAEARGNAPDPDDTPTLRPHPPRGKGFDHPPELGPMNPEDRVIYWLTGDLDQFQDAMMKATQAEVINHFRTGDPECEFRGSITRSIP